MDNLTGGERIVLAAAAVVVIDLLLLPWHLVESLTPAGRAVNDDITAVQAPLGALAILAAVIAIVMIAQIALAKFTTVKLPAPPVPWSRVHLMAGFAVLGLLVLKVVLEPDDLGLGCYVGVLAAAVLAYGGWVVNQESRVHSDGSVHGGSPPPPGGSSRGYGSTKPDPGSSVPR